MAAGALVIASILATWCEELTHLKRPWCWERLKVGGEGDDRGWEGWMASPTQWTRVWVGSGSQWWIGKPGVCAIVHGVSKSRTWLSNWTELRRYFRLCNHTFSITSTQLYLCVARKQPQAIEAKKQAWLCLNKILFTKTAVSLRHEFTNLCPWRKVELSFHFPCRKWHPQIWVCEEVIHKFELKKVGESYDRHIYQKENDSNSVGFLTSKKKLSEVFQQFKIVICAKQK